MPFRTYCQHKECRKEMLPLIDKKTNKVYCGECDLEITTIDPFMKAQLIGMGQVKTANAKKASFGVVCPKCSVKDTPTIKGDLAFCRGCNTDITASISKPFILMLKEMVKNK